VYELSLVPLIYVRVFLNVIKLAEPLDAIKLLIGWAIGGPLYLLYGVSIDMYYYFKILCDSKMDDEI
jgi:hypothetical protein